MSNSLNSKKGKHSQCYSRFIPKNIQLEWSRLFTKQLYGIGKDILYEDNLLLQHGFSRIRPANSNEGSSQYSINDLDGKIVLWGFWDDVFYKK